MWKQFYTYIGLCLTLLLPVYADVDPISIRGRYFVNSNTNEPFIIKGLDYQPGGSSGVTDYFDPLSDPKTCARDIVLFQDLGINTIRVYSVNPNLNHDGCMSLLAAAQIYLILDVNSPKQNEHLNRYEPHTTYTEAYLTHIFLVIEQFSYYNNTLGFFAGNEIVNDGASAKSSLVYIKAVVRDMKKYISFNSPRHIPVGYSAADDLMFRTSLSEYLECEGDNPYESVDFYGVNSYQWCGEQSFYTSGYNILVDDYSAYTRPVFFSEYGCNEVVPRTFGEVMSIYSNEMIDVFSGGLVYEYSQEPNNYGLVEINQDGSIMLQEDYFQLKAKYEYVPEVDVARIKLNIKNFDRDLRAKVKGDRRTQPSCSKSYPNLDISRTVPEGLADSLITENVGVTNGHHIELTDENYHSKFQYFLSDGTEYEIAPFIKPMSSKKVEIKHPLFLRFQSRT